MEEPSTFIQPRDIAFSHTTKSLNSDITSTELKNMEYDAASLENVKQNETTEEIPNWEDTCRVCANCRDHMIPIFENEGAEHNLSNKIHMYLPIEVSKTDSLPLKLCYHCAATLLAWHDLVTGCLDAEKRLLQTQAEMQQKETIQLKKQQILNSNALMEGIITQNEESGDDFQSIATQKLQNPSLPPSSHELQNTEIIQLKYIEKSNLTELSDGNVVENELVDDPEPVETQISEITSLPQKETESSLICEREESCTIQQLEQTSQIVEQSSLDQETAERSDRMKKPFKLLIDTQSICRKGIKIEIEVADHRTIAKDGEDSTWKSTLYPNIEDPLPRPDSPESAEKRLNCSEETFKDVGQLQNSPRCERIDNEDLAECKKVSADKSEDSQDDESMMIDESNTNENCASFKVKCTVCSRVFTNIKDLQIHAKDHKELPESRKIYQCIECDKSFRLKDSFVRHLRIHRDERPFTCHVCGKQFRDSGGLSRHLKDVHAKLKNFSCDICGNSFSSKATRDDHRRTHTGERPYVCETCNKSFKSKACLYSHNKLHTNEFPHPCVYCNKKFRRRQEMLVHATTHTGEKNYSCDVCFMRFRVKTEVARHKLTHSEEKPFVCSTCGLRFRQNRYLNNHIKSRHTQPWKE